ncbi:hypothetical protein FOWG_17865 [Fusarium oxysporum f. sp. lycopersici MN25]|nr:hypothetical protein FOWG_17865 [Fusarium oxysporum f. sp. lycopersici MN25]
MNHYLILTPNHLVHGYPCLELRKTPWLDLRSDVFRITTPRMNVKKTRRRMLQKVLKKIASTGAMRAKLCDILGTRNQGEMNKYRRSS